MRLKFAALTALLLLPGSALADWCQQFSGTQIIGQDQERTYLGKVTIASDKESIFNTFGQYGSSDSVDSIWNPYGMFGGSTGDLSAENDDAKRPPMIIRRKSVFGYLSTNEWLDGWRMSPREFRDRCANYFRKRL